MVAAAWRYRVTFDPGAGQAGSSGKRPQSVLPGFSDFGTFIVQRVGPSLRLNGLGERLLPLSCAVSAAALVMPNRTLRVLPAFTLAVPGAKTADNFRRSPRGPTGPKTVARPP